jgi:Asp-tRNA(Asn)/Glu-tRNA(Gln) amidotransferase C subunit
MNDLGRTVALLLEKISELPPRLEHGDQLRRWSTEIDEAVSQFHRRAEQHEADLAAKTAIWSAILAHPQIALFPCPAGFGDETTAEQLSKILDLLKELEEADPSGAKTLAERKKLRQRQGELEDDIAEMISQLGEASPSPEPDSSEEVLIQAAESKPEPGPEPEPVVEDVPEDVVAEAPEELETKAEQEEEAPAPAAEPESTEPEPQPEPEPELAPLAFSGTDFFWSALSQGRVSLSVSLAESDPTGFPPLPVLRAAALAPWVHADAPDAVHAWEAALTEASQEKFYKGEDDYSLASSLVLWGALTRGALLAPSLLASETAKRFSLPPALAPVQQAAACLAKFALLEGPWPAAQDLVGARRQALSRRADWVLEQFSALRPPYGPSLGLVRSLAAPEGLVGKLLGAVSRDDRDLVEILAAELKPLGTASDCERRLNDLWRAQRSPDQPMDLAGETRRVLRDTLWEAVTVARAWVDADAAEEGQGAAAMEALKGEFAALREKVSQSLARQQKDSGPGAAAAAAYALLCWEEATAAVLDHGGFNIPGPVSLASAMAGESALTGSEPWDALGQSFASKGSNWRSVWKERLDESAPSLGSLMAFLDVKEALGEDVSAERSLAAARKAVLVEAACRRLLALDLETARGFEGALAQDWPDFAAWAGTGQAPLISPLESFVSRLIEGGKGGWLSGKEQTPEGRSWAAAHKGGSLDDGGCSALISALGFTVVRSSFSGSQGKVEVEPLRDPSVCPLAFWGSEADGMYDVAALWGSTNPEEILGLLDGPPRPTVIFCFEPLSLEVRKTLLSASRERQDSPLVVDAALFGWLLDEKKNRLARLFAAGLPFSWQEPLPGEATLLPLELDGISAATIKEASEHQAVVVAGAEGSGRTAFLRRLEREWTGWACLWESPEAPASRQAFESALHNALKAGGAEGKSWSEAAAWAAGQAGGGLLLIDGADAVLASPEASEVLRQLVREHGLRAAVAGGCEAHRAASRMDHPFGRLSRLFALGAGPLTALDQPWAALESTGFVLSRSARALVRRAVRGRPYASLACAEWVADRARKESLAAEAPPVSIPDSWIEEWVEESLPPLLAEGLEQALGGDPCRTLFAFIAALQEEPTASDVLVRRAQEWWPAESSRLLTREASLTVLEEMEALGVLTRDKEGRWMTSDPGLLSVLGGAEEVESGLMEYCSRPAAPLACDPSFLEGDSPRLAPGNSLLSEFLARKSSEVWAVFGGSSLCLDDLCSALEVEAAHWGGTLIRLEQFGIEELEEALEGVSSGPAGHILAASLGSTVPDREALQLAQMMLDERGEGWVKLLLVGGPEAAEALDLGGEDLHEARLAPWSADQIGQLLKARNVAGAEEEAQRLAASTGGWPSLVYRSLAGDKPTGKEGALLKDAFAITSREIAVLTPICGSPDKDWSSGLLWQQMVVASGLRAQEFRAIQRRLLRTGVVQSRPASAGDEFRVDPYVRGLMKKAA